MAGGPGRRPSPVRLLGRGVVKHCPLCGHGRLFDGWFRMRERCPGCRYRFDREEGFFFGAYVVNLAIVEGLLVLAVVVPAIVLLARDPGADVLPLVLAGLAAAVLGPVVFYPFAKTIWAAIDLIMRPSDVPEPGDKA